MEVGTLSLASSIKKKVPHVLGLYSPMTACGSRYVGGSMVEPGKFLYKHITFSMSFIGGTMT